MKNNQSEGFITIPFSDWTILKYEYEPRIRKLNEIKPAFTQDRIMCIAISFISEY